MKYIIVNTFRVVPVQDDVYNKVINHLRFRGYTCHEAVKPPAKRTLRRWAQQNRAKAICGCWVNAARGTRCEAHNVMSWLTVLQRKHRSN
jgi:hypothetical protein